MPPQPNPKMIAEIRSSPAPLPRFLGLECRWLGVVFDYQLQSKQAIERGDFMGWQADSDPGPGEVPGQGECRPAPLAGFGHGGTQAGAPPSAALAAALEAAAGPEDRYDGADTDALVGIVGSGRRSSRGRRRASWGRCGR